VLIQSCSPVVRHCRIDGNLVPEGASCAGAGMIIDSGNPLIEACSFTGNRASGSEVNFGGALYIANASPSLVGCSFSQNHAGCTTGAGGAVYAYRSAPLIQGCLFDRNSTGGGYSTGGAIYLKESDALIAGCVFIGNSASGYAYGKGGAICTQASDPAIVGCTFTLNSASTSGGAMFSDGGSAPVVANSIFWGDSAPSSAEIGHLGPITVTFSDVNQNGFTASGSNIRLAPLFADPGAMDLGLTAGSPCIDAGSADARGLPSTDFVGIPRILGGAPDMGAYEWNG
jgi:hypothetical protein